MADNIVYNKNIPIQLDYTYIDKDIETENIIENIILIDLLLITVVIFSSYNLLYFSSTGLMCGSALVLPPFLVACPKQEIQIILWQTTLFITKIYQYSWTIHI